VYMPHTNATHEHCVSPFSICLVSRAVMVASGQADLDARTPKALESLRRETRQEREKKQLEKHPAIVKMRTDIDELREQLAAAQVSTNNLLFHPSLLSVKLLQIFRSCALHA
jgi:hypothetical protein